MNYIDELCERYAELAALHDVISKATELVVDSYKKGGKILLCGNGGSAADCEHISGELLKGFLSLREPSEGELEKLAEVLGEDAARLQRGIPAVPLTSLSSAISAFANDVDPSLVYAQLVYALGKPADLLICISTSGNAKNVLNAAKVAKALGVSTVALVGKGGGALRDMCDVSIVAPENETFKIQEYHLPIYHAICAQAERILFK